MASKISSILAISVIMMIFAGCNFSKSTDKVTGIKTAGVGLTCSEVYLSKDERKIGRTTFIYGEKIMLNFSDLQGFVKIGEYIFPGLSVAITSESGDTILHLDDYFKDYTAGLNDLPVLMPINVITDAPVHSHGKYTQSVNIWDKEGIGIFSATLPFSVVENDEISVEKKQVNCQEFILYSGKDKQIITDQEMVRGEEVAMVFIGLTGFQEKEEEFDFGSRLIAIDNSGDTLQDLSNQHQSSFNRSATTNELEAVIYAIVPINNNEITNPVQCKVFLYDNNSDASISAKFELTVNEPEFPY